MTTKIPRAQYPLARWRRLFATKQLQLNLPERPLAAMTWLVNGPVHRHLVNVERLIFVVVRQIDEERRRADVRLAGYRAIRIPWGVAWGDIDNNVFSKNLALRPASDDRGRVLGRRSQLLQVGLRLAGQLKRHRQYPALPLKTAPRLPQLWAGFRHADACWLDGSGPELEALTLQSGQTPEQLFKESRRTFRDLVLYPLDWVSHHGHEAVSIFADLEQYPRVQVFRLPLADPATALQGFSGAQQFDLLADRFDRSVLASRRSRRPRRRRRAFLAAAS